MKKITKTSARLQKKLAVKAETAITSKKSTADSATVTTTPKPVIQKKITLSDLVQTAKQDNAAAFGTVDNKRGLAIVRAILDELSSQLDATEEGTMVLPGFGRFTVKQITVQKNGLQSSQRKIIFRASPNKKSAEQNP